MSVQGTILVVDDEVRSQEALRRVLHDDFEVLCAGSAAEELWPDPVRMIISGYSDSEDIIAGLNEAGIYQYITKPWQPDRLIDIVKEAVQLYRLQKETETAGVDVRATPQHIKKVVSVKRGAAKQLYDFNRIVHSPDSPMHGVIELGRRAAEYDISVLITGESGTGKELLARAIHYGSARARKAFVVENCGALPDELLESELFGCKKGAFTGAYQDRIGLFEVADGGTIFLDEIGETSPAFQVKLRVLQESEIRPLGAQRVRKVDVRVVAATNRDLEAEVEAGRFRRDLYYRLAAFPVHMPALRERPMDIPLIAEGVLASVKTSFNRPSLRFAASALEAFVKCHWPGNVRELQNEIQRMAVLADADELRAPLLGRRNGKQAAAVVHGKLNGSANLKDKVEDLEKSVIISYLERYEGNISRVASELGLSRVGLRNKLSRYDLRKNAKGDAFS
ncbi:sigma-54 dependent transcriptional regulator [Bradyrhizobium sp. Leo170]|uniref:sigma-54-dependent transcriptional regulator n=1 Tax=Bradyrhizobium sp. Leo170 TaxID=1571199 RepID=UPI00102E7452|nr:sigma-54 dependent transcriptional regulator [Bradyrhizobium sp. Leo170]TAI60566.1 sigma-54-dependent Fis family transcriptional regulator [Bradyrhizobium sp. Leo170]